MAKLDPYREGCPPEVLQRQAEQYARLFRIFKKHRDVTARVSFWNLHDGESWLNDFPWKRVSHPLLFDRAGRPAEAGLSRRVEGLGGVIRRSAAPASLRPPEATGSRRVR